MSLGSVESVRLGCFDLVDIAPSDNTSMDEPRESSGGHYAVGGNRDYSQAWEA